MWRFFWGSTSWNLHERNHWSAHIVEEFRCIPASGIQPETCATTTGVSHSLSRGQFPSCLSMGSADSYGIQSLPRHALQRSRGVTDPSAAPSPGPCTTACIGSSFRVNSLHKA